MNPVLVNHPDVSFVDQRRRLQSIARTQLAHLNMRKAVKLALDKRKKFFERVRVTLAPIN
jgi:hypothetical protein